VLQTQGSLPFCHQISKRTLPLTSRGNGIDISLVVFGGVALVEQLPSMHKGYVQSSTITRTRMHTHVRTRMHTHTRTHRGKKSRSIQGQGPGPAYPPPSRGLAAACPCLLGRCPLSVSLCPLLLPSDTVMEVIAFPKLFKDSPFRNGLGNLP
jgi:hypothetical protein